MRLFFPLRFINSFTFLSLFTWIFILLIFLMMYICNHVNVILMHIFTLIYNFSNSFNLIQSFVKFQREQGSLHSIAIILEEFNHRFLSHFTGYLLLCDLLFFRRLKIALFRALFGHSFKSVIPNRYLFFSSSKMARFRRYTISTLIALFCGTLNDIQKQPAMQPIQQSRFSFFIS